jgi:AbrB family looped-hinge helix DNA binding protein
MSATRTTVIESGNRIQLPAEWAEAFGLRDRVRLDRTGEGILVRPCPAPGWDEVFAAKLAIGRAAPGPEGLEVSRDDLLF